MDRKKMITYALIAVVGLIVLWQVIGMISGDGGAADQPIILPNPETPVAASLLPAQTVQKQAQQAPMTERELQLMKLQQETQAKYLAALNELQMLRVEKDIAETNRDVSKARLENITAQKSIVDLLAPPKQVATPDMYAQGLDTAAQSKPTTVTATTDAPATAPSSGDYKVISVSKLRGAWMAVIGAGGNLYSVKQGDVLPVDGSTVVSIDRNGIQLEKDGKTRKLSMVPII